MSVPIRDLTRFERKTLLQGPQACVILNMADGTPPLVIPVPRAALEAFSTVASKQLADGNTASVILQPGAAAPGALRILLEWIQRTCDARDYMPLPKKAALSHNVMMYHAALALGMTEVKITIGGYLNVLVEDFCNQPLRWNDVYQMLTILPQTSMIIQRLVENLAHARRMGLLPLEYKQNLETFAKTCPELHKQLDKHDQRMSNNQTLLRPIGNGPNSNTRNWVSRKNNTERRGGHTRRREFADASEHLLSDADVDRIMGRG
ncbi:uncharacterized protein K452DRAFT_336076 [Aplosporella prunicola CBS 121167]|uniref:BTB domain-containing protein n=1 Tax=Aplosporella prunicola CBS 121167 TaxID=1176127 RepID=A0A6A6B7E6_9PEZI|nr:uncharacterized protein K452DRAFT_336076 [Aplosporella prunicola CBS 121167]KAF2140082.1 hypothetical protein K452DRAFT_336076 [Aplosporella prunicola CBS 121167]